MDDFAEFLGICDWYDWKKDRGFLPPEGILENADKEGATNPDLLNAKAPLAVVSIAHSYQSLCGVTQGGQSAQVTATKRSTRQCMKEFVTA